MPSKIRLLDDITINKIAAGEVIENPSSVVKELVENCLDAGAFEITVEAHAGGRHLIRITDNGVGMGRDDALLALERHATSKLKGIDDLTTLTSLGFRGEAVPSIASISKFSVLTAEENGKGTFVRVEGGKILCAEDSVRERGTTIEVKDIFYNMPVRKKFLKSPASDETAILKGFIEQAIARPDIKFQLILNQKLIFLLQPEDPASRIASALGEAFKKELIPLNGTEIRGYIGTPHSARPNRGAQFLFLNGRPIHSPFISWAIKEAYSTHLQPRRFPIFVLWLTLAPELVDVNVHPQKREVRFREEGRLQTLIIKAIHQALSLSRQEFFISAPISMAEAPQWNLEACASPQPPTSEVMTTPQSYLKSLTPNLLGEELHDELPVAIQRSAARRVAATLKGYILAEVPGQEGLQLIDQQRAHARILFERLEKGGCAPLEKEVLLLPFTFELSKVDSRILLEHLIHFESMGFEIREFGPETFALEAYPSSYAKENLGSLIPAFIEELKEFTATKVNDNKVKTRLAEKSSHLSLRSSKTLSHTEALRLVEDLWKCEQPWESPLGKPTLVHLNGESLAKYFI